MVLTIAFLLVVYILLFHGSNIFGASVSSISSNKFQHLISLLPVELHHCNVIVCTWSHIANRRILYIADLNLAMFPLDIYLPIINSGDNLKTTRALPAYIPIFGESCKVAFITEYEKTDSLDWSINDTTQVTQEFVMSPEDY